jgi:hypothetical protein
MIAEIVFRDLLIEVVRGINENLALENMSRWVGGVERRYQRLSGHGGV